MKKHLAFALVSSLSLALLNGSTARADDKQEKSKTKPQTIDLAADLKAEAPGNWKVQASDRQFRVYDVALPSPKDDVPDGSLVVYHFGKGGGGDLDANLKRWYGMMEQPDDESSEEVGKKQEIDLPGGKVVWIDVPGTYLDRPFPASPKVTKRQHYRLLAAMIDAGEEGPYWIRAVGPDAVMREHRPGFEQFLKSIRKK